MLVARYWAEVRLAERYAKWRKPIVVRRLGWSNQSQEAAEHMARQRAREALDRRLAGELRVPWREGQAGHYAAAGGMPIREELVEETPQGVLTRNSYGAVCLNTEQATFLDIDDDAGAGGAGCSAGLAGLIGGAVVGGLAMAKSGGAGIFAGALVGAFVGGVTFAQGEALRRRLRSFWGRPLATTRRRLAAWCREHPRWRVALYQTPAGLRVLLLHACLRPDDPELATLSKQLWVDPKYTRMTQLQECFRARLTPKPWRIGLPRLGPRPAARWPLPDAAAGIARQAWIEAYDHRRADFAACRFLEELGGGERSSTVAAVRALHDRWCGAGTNLPLA